MFRLNPNRDPWQHSCVPEICVQNYYITLEKMSYLTTVMLPTMIYLEGKYNLPLSILNFPLISDEFISFELFES